MQEGDTFELTLDEAGKYEYVCNVHAPAWRHDHCQ